jgi:hypothetical protein
MSARRSLLAALVPLCALVGVLLLSASASATDTHDYLSQFEEVPAGAGVTYSGALSGEASSMTVDSGHIWIAEKLSGTGNFRVDEFSATTGAFISQLAHAEYYDPEYLGVAVGHLAGVSEPTIYLAEDSLQGSVQIGVYGESGAKQATWTGAQTPAKSFGREVHGVAVDSSTSLSDWAAGDIYVPDPSQKVIDVFGHEADGKEKYVTQLTGISAAEAFNEPTRVTVDSANGDVIVADGPSIDLFEPTTFEHYAFVRKLTPPSAIAFECSFSSCSLNANDGEGDIYVIGEVGENGKQIGAKVFEFDSTGAYVGQLTPASVPGGQFGSPGAQSVAADPVTHDVFVSTSNESGAPGAVDVFGPNVVLPDVTTMPATGLKAIGEGHIEAMLNGTVDLDKAGSATCSFEWGRTESLGEIAPCPAPVEAEGSVPVQARITGLLPDTTYFYRLQAVNANGVNSGEPWQDQQFTTFGPSISSTAVSNVAGSSATLEARIDPNKTPTTYYFQYGTDTAYGSYAPAAPGAELGSGEGDIEINQHLQGLSAATTYHYRVVAVSEVAGGTDEAFYGPDQTFTTQTVGFPFQLPDNRQWEMVSPPDKHGAQIYPSSQASVNGGALAFEAAAPTEAEPQGYANPSSVLARRGAEGWVSQFLGDPHEAPAGALELNEYKAFSRDLSLAIVQPAGPFTPALSAEASEQTAYLRTNYLNGDLGEPCASSCYRPLVTGARGHANVPPGTVFGPEENIDDPGCSSPCGPLFEGATPDLSHVVLQASAPLTATQLPRGPYGRFGLYEWTAGKLTLVSVLPGPGGAPTGGEAAVSPALGLPGVISRNAISDDGTRVIWADSTTGHLYMRDTATEETVELDAVQGGNGSGDASPEFQSASSDGSKVFFLDQQKLTADSEGNGNGGKDLFECEMVMEGGRLRCKLLDLTPPSFGEPAQVLSQTIGANEDGSYYYFVAEGVLAPGAVPGDCRGSDEGACNLYVYHDGVTKLIARLAAADNSDWSAATSATLLRLSARVSPNGRWLAFMSQMDLTGYDTTDAISGMPDGEVYLYDADSGRLVCASCNPTGARPVGVDGDTSLLDDYDGQSEWLSWMAASIPSWKTDFESRSFLSNSGRLFFNSTDALVPQDANGGWDVYEYEPPGVGDCTRSSANFAERSEGCVGLISSGTSAREAAFLEASENGGDVFFLTSEKLSQQDYDDALDIYDAHECTGAAPCFTSPPVALPPCDTGDSCKPGPTPQPASFGAPASATFSGAGNVIPSPSPPAATPKSLTRAQKLARALKACRHGGSRGRTACERKAKKRYAPTRSRKATARKRGGR